MPDTMSPPGPDIATKAIFTLEGSLQPYAWGDVEAIPALLGIDAQGPIAEYWMGAHHSAPSHIVEARQRLDALIAADPVRHLGADRAEFPFLMKVLAAAKPLSIQIHPTAEQATAGFIAENTAGVALDAPHRVYRDPNPKPELLVALDRFSARVGFRPIDETVALLDAIERAEPQRWADVDGAELRDTLESGGYGAALTWIVARPASIQRLVADTVVASAHALGDLDRETVAFAAAHHGGDIGILTLLLLNHVELEPGDGVFLDAGTLHAYLSGVAIEVMANSDNVIRGGLTPKHIAADQLVALADTTPHAVDVQRRNASVWRYRADPADFSLVTIAEASYTSTVQAPRVIFVSEGNARIVTDDDERVAYAGTALYVPADAGTIGIHAEGRVWVSEGR